MDKEDLEILSNAADSLGIINMAFSTLQNARILYFVTDYSVKNSLDPLDAIAIPQCLLDEFKEMLINHYAKRYNIIVEELKTLTI